jgi:hypothetical protein
MPVIQAFWKLRHEDHKFNASQGQIASLGCAATLSQKQFYPSSVTLEFLTSSFVDCWSFLSFLHLTGLARTPPM